jgi:hypothetical protein
MLVCWVVYLYSAWRSALEDLAVKGGEGSVDVFVSGIGFVRLVVRTTTLEQ